MADAQVGNKEGVAAVVNSATKQLVNLNGGAAIDTGLDMDNTDTIAAMKTRLAAIDAGFYTAARLNTMTYNDMVYAIRQNDFLTTIRQ